MGLKLSKTWTPPAMFEQICKEQGFQAISPPLCIENKIIYSIDLSNDDIVYYVERAINSDFSILAKHEVNIETNKQTGNTIVIRKEGINYIVLEMELNPNTGDIYVQSISGNYTIHRSCYNHEHFPKFKKTTNKEYNRLKNLFENDQYSMINADLIL